VTAPIQRIGGRIILLDDEDRVLLIHERIDGGWTHWLTPGGGLEAGETAQVAAVREAWEELGIRLELSADAPEVFTQRRTWSWDGLTYDQTDHFFAARVATGLTLRAAAPTALEQQTWLGFRWWSLTELQQTSEVIEPPGLAGLLAQLAPSLPALEHPA
jgi:8-oxo-dGTP pyrophosphatase MutT (NUDIX family)